MLLPLRDSSGRPRIDWSFLGALPEGLSFARASSAWYYNSAGILTTAASGSPRFDYDPLTLQPKGLLIEEQRTNVALHTDMSGAAASTLPTGWVDYVGGSGVTRTIVGTGTENGMNYLDVRLAATAASSGAYQLFWIYSNFSLTVSTAYTNSYYTRIVSGSWPSSAFIQSYWEDSTSVYISGATSTSLTSTLTKFSATGTSSSTSGRTARAYANIGSLNGAFDVTIRFYTPQFEAGAFATSFIPTTTAAVTRAADSLNTTNIPWFNASQGSFVLQMIEVGQYPASTYRYVMGFNDGTSSNLLGFYQVPSSSTYNAYVRSSGSAVIDQTISGSSAVGSVTKLGMRYASGNYGMVINGGVVTTIAAASVPSGISRLDLGTKSSGGDVCSFWLQRLRYWPTAQDNMTLKQVTQ